MASTLNHAYLGLNKAQEYTLKPAYLYGASAFQLETKHFGCRDTSKAMDKLLHCIWLAILFKRVIARIRGRKQPLLIIYASVTGMLRVHHEDCGQAHLISYHFLPFVVSGNAAKYASDLGAIMRTSFNVTFFDACGLNAAADLEVLSSVASSYLIIFVSSTQGNGELPSLSNKFFTSLFDKHGNLLHGKSCAVLGFGSSSYPVFCGAAVHLSKRLAEVNSKEIVHRGECDSVKGEARTFFDWITNLVMNLANMPNASGLVKKLSNDMLKNTTSSLVRTRSMVESVKVEVFSKEKVQEAAALSYMRRRRGSMGSIHRRCSSSSSIDGSTHSTKGVLGPLDEEQQRIIQIIDSSTSHSLHKQYLEGRVKCREDLIFNATDGGSETVARKTSLVKIDLDSCGSKY